MRKYIVLVALVLCLFSSCEKWRGEETHDYKGQIYLSAAVNSIIQTKVPYHPSEYGSGNEMYYAPSPETPLRVDVWASDTYESFKGLGWDGSDAWGHKVAVHTSAYFQSGDPQLLSAAVYPPPISDNVAPPVYFVAMHPQSNDANAWNTNKDAEGNDIGTIAQYTFDGWQDVMFAKRVDGKYDVSASGGSDGNVVTESPILDFKRLLTLFTLNLGLQLEAGETAYQVQEAWGRVSDIRIRAAVDGAPKDLHNTVSIDLTRGEAFDVEKSNISSPAESHYTFSGNSEGRFFAKDKDTYFPMQQDGGLWYEIPEAKTEVAYTMCQPVVADNAPNSMEYIITVTTEQRGEIDIPIDLKSEEGPYVGYTRAKHFAVTLLFKKGRATSITAVVTDWTTGGYGFGSVVD